MIVLIIKKIEAMSSLLFISEQFYKKKQCKPHVIGMTKII